MNFRAPLLSAKVSDAGSRPHGTAVMSKRLVMVRLHGFLTLEEPSHSHYLSPAHPLALPRREVQMRRTGVPLNYLNGSVMGFQDLIQQSKPMCQVPACPKHSARWGIGIKARRQGFCPQVFRAVGRILFPS